MNERIKQLAEQAGLRFTQLMSNPIVGHCENCLYDIKVKIEKNGSADQKEALADSMEALERLYFLLQEEE